MVKILVFKNSSNQERQKTGAQIFILKHRKVTFASQNLIL